MPTDVLTFTGVKNREDQWGRAWARTYDVTGSTSYPTGGFTIPLSRIGLKSLDGVILVGASGATSFRPTLIPGATPKLMYINTTSGADASGDVSAITYRLTFFGD